MKSGAIGVVAGAMGALLAALFSLSCCVAPLIFVLFGVSFSFLSSLEALNPFRPLFVAFSLYFVGYGFWRIYLSKKPLCADKKDGFYTKFAFWGFSILSALMLAYPFIEGFIFGEGQ